MATCPSCRTQYPDSADSCPTDGEALLPDSVFTAADSELAPGTMVGEYRIEGKLGEGAFGAVYRAVHPMIGKAAAIKVIGRAISYDPQMVSRFVAEARAVNQIRHRNIIDVFGFGVVPDGRHYYAMELLDGATFDAYLRMRGRLPLDQALPILRGIARALDAAHAKGIFHRDLKPENVFLVANDDGPPEPKLLDFGIAKLTTPGAANHKTKTGAAMGTPYYMSPEQCRGNDVDGRTDVYAFGVMAFEVLTGTLPYQSESALDLLFKHLSDPVPLASERCRELGTAFDDVFKKLMAKEREERPATASQALELIARAGGVALSSSAGASNVAPAALQAAATAPAPSAPLAATEMVHAATMIQTAAPSVPAQTLGASSADVRVTTPRWSPRVLAGVAAAALIVGALGVVALKGAGTTRAAAPPEKDTPTAATAATAPAASTAPAALVPLEPGNISLTLEGAPKDATVSLGDKPLGTGSGPFVVARGQGGLPLKVLAPGFKPFTSTFEPKADATVTVKLERAVGGASTAPATKPAGKGATPQPTISKDLSQPDFTK